MLVIDMIKCCGCHSCNNYALTLSKIFNSEICFYNIDQYIFLRNALVHMYFGRIGVIFYFLLLLVILKLVIVKRHHVAESVSDFSVKHTRQNCFHTLLNVSVASWTNKERQP